MLLRLVAAWLFLALGCVAASAHATLVRSEPADGAVLDAGAAAPRPHLQRAGLAAGAPPDRGRRDGDAARQVHAHRPDRDGRPAAGARRRRLCRELAGGVGRRPPDRRLGGLLGGHGRRRRDTARRRRPRPAARSGDRHRPDAGLCRPLHRRRRDVLRRLPRRAAEGGDAGDGGRPRHHAGGAVHLDRPPGPRCARPHNRQHRRGAAVARGVRDQLRRRRADRRLRRARGARRPRGGAARPQGPRRCSASRPSAPPSPRPATPARRRRNG